MANTGEDAATVLEQFVHDVANLPAEIAHLLEEIQAKDQVIQECRQQILNRDNSLQRHIKQMGAHVKHPKEEQIAKHVLSNYDRAQALQEDKVALVHKACFLLDRQVKRLDLKIRDLATEGSLTVDNQLPSLLHDSPANLVPPAAVSATSTGVNTPLHVLPFSAGSSTNVANAAMARMAIAAAQMNRGPPQVPIAGLQPHPLLNGAPMAQKQRESSAGAAPDIKRRRLNVNIGSVPIPPSNLGRQTSLGPSTPKAGTPGSRAGSAGPRPKKPSKNPAPHEALMRKNLSKGGLSKRSAKRLLGGARASPSTTGEEASEGSGSEEGNDSAARRRDGAADEEEADERGYDDEGDDNRLYCTCQSVSHGNMVACDNENCHYEWFHWECVGLTQEPKGRWLCPECKKLPAGQVKLAK